VRASGSGKRANYRELADASADSVALKPRSDYRLLGQRITGTPFRRLRVQEVDCIRGVIVGQGLGRWLVRHTLVTNALGIVGRPLG